MSEETEFRYGTITGKYVIYRGKNAELKNASEPIFYLNVEDYLKKFVKAIVKKYDCFYFV